MFPQDRSALRAKFTAVVQKARSEEPMDPEEQRLIDLMREHPEYEAEIADDEEIIDREYTNDSEVNPFLHLGLHLAILDQVHQDRPAGVRRTYRQLIDAYAGDRHAAEHAMMSCLAEMLWRAVHENVRFNDKAYLRCLRRRKEG